MERPHVRCHPQRLRRGVIGSERRRREQTIDQEKQVPNRVEIASINEPIASPLVPVRGHGADREQDLGSVKNWAIQK
jgi:hypothetical protein